MATLIYIEESPPGGARLLNLDNMRYAHPAYMKSEDPMAQDTTIVWTDGAVTTYSVRFSVFLELVGLVMDDIKDYPDPATPDDG